MDGIGNGAPDSSALRVALWRALHVEVDAPPHVLKDEIGLLLANPDPQWRQRPDMDPQGTRGYRAGIVARARLIEDLVAEQAGLGIDQYVILGAGLDSFVQRRPEIASRLTVFEVDQAGTQEWKRRRLVELGYGIPDYLKLVPVNFEAGQGWLERLNASGFDAERGAVIASTGVAMYLSKEANVATLRQIASLAPCSTLAMTFLLPLERIDADERAQHQMVYERAKAAGTPFVSFFEPSEMVALARQAGFKEARHLSRDQIVQRYFAGRADALKPASGEEFLIAST
jgi:methyltransferase (TIGR00027 family)